MLNQNTNPPKVIKASKHGIEIKHLDKDAKSIIAKLNNLGFDAFIVGGFVRDSILGLKPKDCDVVTDATPEEIKKAIPKTRIIGRRFKIVHARSGRNITEISTFRSSSKRHTQKSHKGIILNIIFHLPILIYIFLLIYHRAKSSRINNIIKRNIL